MPIRWDEYLDHCDDMDVTGDCTYRGSIAVLESIARACRDTNCFTTRPIAFDADYSDGYTQKIIQGFVEAGLARAHAGHHTLTHFGRYLCGLPLCPIYTGVDHG